jgi:hypothetical protein
LPGRPWSAGCVAASSARGTGEHAPDGCPAFHREGPGDGTLFLGVFRGALP